MTPTPDERIAQLEAELAALRAEMQDFTYTVSHDLRASLRHIVSYAHLVQEDAGPQLNEEVQGFLATITDSAQHMGRLMDGLLELSRMGTAPVRLEALALNDLVADVIDELAPRAAGREVHWQVGEQLPQVRADSALLRQVLVQVLDNALKFTGSRAAAHIAVTSQIDLAAGTVHLAVRDDGVGYNPSMQSRLFRAFQRLHPVAQFPGIGMGLALVRKAMERMGGAAQAEGTLDAGCTVTLTLPLA